MRRIHRQNQIGSLDSLLDTMTNVVGILVILLAVTQLGVGDAVKRILRSRTGDMGAVNVSVEHLKLTEKEAQELSELVEKLRAEWNDLAAQTELDRQRVAETRKLIEELKREIRENPSVKVNTDEVRKLIEQRETMAEQLEDKIANAEQELAELKAKIESTPVYQTPAPKVVTLPNPRPAPKNAEPVYFICRQGRIAPVKIDRLQQIVDAGVRRSVGEPDANGEIDCDKLVEFFDSRTLGDEYFRIRIRVHNFRPWMVLEMRPGAGESTEQLVESGSQYQQAVRTIDKTGHYARFLVWPDSFDTYIEARAIASDMDMLAGWEPRSGSDEYSIAVDGQLVCKGRPTPKPQPVTPKPEPVDVGDEKTPRPPPPADTID